MKMSTRKNSIVVNPDSKKEVDMIGDYDYKVVKVVAAYNNGDILELSDLRLIPSDEFIPHQVVSDE